MNRIKPRSAALCGRWLMMFMVVADTVCAQNPFEPEVPRRSVSVDRLDSESWEVGLNGGVISIEDFETNGYAAIEGRYHVNEDLFLSVSAGWSEAGQSSYETLSGAVDLFRNNDRTLWLYQAGVGYNLFPGEAFVTRTLTFNNRFFLLGGLGVADFGGDHRLAVNVGFGYQLDITDFLACQVMARDHLWNMDITGMDKTTHNIEFSSGISVFF